MVFDPNRRLIHIFGGQRNDVYLSDLWSYSLDAETVVRSSATIHLFRAVSDR
jgi:hypothetical protein